MRIGIVSDTHSRPLPKQMIKDFQDVDFIIHAGDFCEVEDYEAIKKIKDLKAVYGNMDSLSMRKLLPRKQIFPCGKFSIGVFHGEGPAQGVLEKVRSQFEKDKVDVVVFGHSHKAVNERINGVLYFNPGSPNDDVCAPFCSYGILEISDKEVQGNIVKVKNG
jgi:putative phosphoesterase